MITATRQNQSTVFKQLNVASFESVTNPNSIHGIYPYRGKISALEAKAIVTQLPQGVLLDPFCGSGTILYEADRAGLDTIGVDNNPLAIWVAKGKLASAQTTLEREIVSIEKIIAIAKKRKRKQPLTPLLEKSFHKKTAYEVYSVIDEFEGLSEYARACLLGAIALTARGCNQYKWTSSTVGKDIQPKRYVNFYEKLLHKIKKHIYQNAPLHRSEVHLYDSRKITDLLNPNSVDYVFTSPPYFDALDYTAYYGQIIYGLLGINRFDIKKNLIQTVKEYEVDMKEVLAKLVEVTKKDGLIIFVVGDKKIEKNIINGGTFFSKLLDHQPNIIHERRYTGSSSQIFDRLNKTERKEQVIIWDKSTW